MKFLTLEQIKKHLAIDADFTDDDDYLESLESAAVDVLERDIDYSLDNFDTLPAALAHGLLLIIGNFYDNRESVSHTSIVKIPQSLEWIADLYRDYSVDNNIKP